MDGLALGTINLIVLPILGYWFQYKFNLTHYRAERLIPQRLIFHAGLYALVLVTVARLMVFVADFQMRSQATPIAWVLISVLFGFIALTLISLIVAGLHHYSPVSIQDGGEPGLEKADVPPHSELWRFVVGAVVGILLVVIVALIYSSTPFSNRLPTELLAISVLCILFGLTKWQYTFINQYIEFRFFSIALRIGLFGVLASLAFSCFLFYYPVLVSYWAQLVNVPGSGIAMMACILGLGLWWPLNLLYPYEAANTRLHYSNGTTALDRLLYQASLAQNLLCLSMKDGKVYIGYIQELPANPEDRNSYLEILPVQSGYRDKDTREMKLTTFYQDAYTKLVESEADEEEWLVFLKILKIDDILSAGRFDPDAYVLFNKKSDETSQPIEEFLLDDRSG